jgi:hypothetical protein
MLSNEKCSNNDVITSVETSHSTDDLADRFKGHARDIKYVSL